MNPTRSRPVLAPVMAANWKMHKGPRETRDFFDAFLPLYAPRQDRTVIFFPPSVSLPAAVDSLAGRLDIGLGVQSIFWQDTGAFTGEISAPMAAQAGARYALAGHSERRQLFHEADGDVGRKAAAALNAGLVPLICVGETLEERRAGKLEAVLERQLEAALEPSADHATANSLILAYEPVWAIGTGVNATPDDAAAAHAILRSRLAIRFGDAEAANVRILYGGSVKPENAAELLAATDVDGLLVGGASLDAAAFARITSIF